MMLTKKLRIFMRIYKQFDPSFSLICYYQFIFGLLRISIGLSVFRFVANEYQRRAILLLSTIHNIRSAICSRLPISQCVCLAFSSTDSFQIIHGARTHCLQGTFSLTIDNLKHYQTFIRQINQNQPTHIEKIQLFQTFWKL